jgi:hypothetical protein
LAIQVLFRAGNYLSPNQKLEIRLDQLDQISFLVTSANPFNGKGGCYVGTQGDVRIKVMNEMHNIAVVGK